MKEQLRKAIETLSVKAGASTTTAEHALKLTQAALNLAHVESVMGQNKKEERLAAMRK